MTECLDCRDLIPRYDREHILFFLDPPSWNFNCYQHTFVQQDFYDLPEVLAGIKGRFLMPINDTRSPGNVCAVHNRGGRTELLDEQEGREPVAGADGVINRKLIVVTIYP